MLDPDLDPTNRARSLAALPRDEGQIGWKRWVVGIAVVSAMVIFQCIATAITRGSSGELQLRLVASSLGLPLVLIPISLSFRRAARGRFGATRTLLTALATSIIAGATLGIATCFVIQNIFTAWPRRSGEVYAVFTTAGAAYGLLTCAVWVLALVYPFAAEDARTRALEAEKLRIEAEQLRSAAELSRLRAQLEPHFLLNTLHAIAGLVTQDPREARRLLGCLGDLLRDALHDADELETLGEEIAWLRRYAEILESRHAGSLRFRWEISGDAEAVRLPRLLLQPLVENAVKHGALRRSGGGQVIVRAALEDPGGDAARLVCAIEDNGPGMPAGAPRAGAFGLRAVRRRLELKCAGARLGIASSPAGTRAVVEIPCVGAKGARAAEPEAAR